MAPAGNWCLARWPGAPAGVQGFTTSRHGGHSAAPWDSLNLGDHVGDDPAAVAANRARLAAVAALPAAPRWLRQVHGCAVADLDLLAPDVVPEADAAVTRRAGTVLAILTADCLPVLVASDDGAVLGAAHAGWRGLAGGVLEALLAAMRARAAGGTPFHAWIGPGIGPRHFEVGDEVRAAFLAADAGAAPAFTPAARAGHWYADLAALAARRLAALGVAQVAQSHCCTYERAADCYSHRRDVQHHRLPSTGRMATLLWRPT